jgi:hypothetical protein
LSSRHLCANDVAANFCKTIHVPVPDDQTHTSDLNISASAFTVEGITFPLGNCKHTFTSMEHGTSKKLYFASKKSAEAGNIVITAFYYRFPMDIADFSVKDQSASERQQKYIKEYTFLRSRRENWSGNRATTWNSQTQRLIDEDVSVPLHKTKPNNGSSRTQTGSGGKKIAPGESVRSAPKLRKTMMSVGYVGIHWPENGTGDQEEKIMHRLHIAEEKRLHMLKEAADKARRRNIEVDRKIRRIAEDKQRQGKDAAKLRALLHKKEEALVKLKYELEESERNAAAAAALVRRRRATAELRTGQRQGRGQLKTSTSCSRSSCPKPQSSHTTIRKNSSATQTTYSSRHRSARYPERRRVRSLDNCGRGRTGRGSCDRYPRSFSVDSAPRHYSHKESLTKRSSAREKSERSGGRTKSAGRGKGKTRYSARTISDANALDLVVGRKTKFADDDSASLLIDVPSARVDSLRKENSRKNSFLDKIRMFQEEQQRRDDDRALKELLVTDHPTDSKTSTTR